MRVRTPIAGAFLIAVLTAASAAVARPAHERERDGDRERPRPVLIELFTSQGCSDCPAADRVLSELAQRPDIIALSLPITYWDMLGWRDTLATEANTQRQKAYSKAMHRNGIYTPQIVVDGMLDVVGNQKDHVLAAVAQRAQDMLNEQPVRMMVSAGHGHVIVAIAAVHDKSKPEATVWVMRTLSQVNVHVEDGENKNRQLVYTNVVRGMQRAGEWNGNAVTLDVPLAPPRANEKDDGLAIVVQSHDYGAVLGARMVSYVDHDSGPAQH